MCILNAQMKTKALVFFFLYILMFLDVFHWSSVEVTHVWSQTEKASSVGSEDRAQEVRSLHRLSTSSIFCWISFTLLVHFSRTSSSSSSATAV